MSRLPAPDLTDRPHDITVERAMSASPDLLYQASTRHFELTGPAGTKGTETIVRVELVADGDGTGSGTALRLTHSGFADEGSAEQHAEAWPRVLAQLDEQIIRHNAGEQPA